jgi:hypothetical protein
MSSPALSGHDLRERGAIRRWAENRQAASAVEARELSVSGCTASQSFSVALGLLELYVGLHGWPPPDDPVDERDNIETWNRFARLRARLRP